MGDSTSDTNIQNAQTHGAGTTCSFQEMVINANLCISYEVL